FPDPGPAVVATMGRLKAMCLAAGLPARFGFTGSNFAPEYGITARAEHAFSDEQSRRGRPGGEAPPAAGVCRRGSQLGSFVRWAKGPWRGYPSRVGVAWLEHDLPAEWPAGGRYLLTVRVRNEGSRPWLAADPGGRCVDLTAFVGGVPRSMGRVPH